MPEIKLKARIQNKYETLEDWNNTPDSFIPLKGEVCYALDNNLLYLKVGDGETKFNDLPWMLNQGDWNESNENSPSYIKNKLGYTKFDTEKSLLYSYNVTENEYPNFEIMGVEEGLGTVAIMTDYFNKSSDLDIDIFVDNETTPEVSLRDFNIIKSASIENNTFYYAGNIYLLAIQFLGLTEEILQEMEIEKTEDNFGFICVDESDAFGCYIWTEAVATSYYRLDISGYGTTIVPIPQEFLDIDYDQFVGRFDDKNNYGEIFNDYARNRATNSYAHAEGYDTKAYGRYSHAEGMGGENSYSFDTINSIYTYSIYASIPEELVNTSNQKYRLTYQVNGESKEHKGTIRYFYSNQFTTQEELPQDITAPFTLYLSTGAMNTATHSEGYETLAQGPYTHAEGYQTQAYGDASHSEGWKTIVKEDYSHAEGYQTQAIQTASHSEGYETEANGKYSHSEGYKTKAEGESSHSEGKETVALKDCSHAEGHKTQATGLYAHTEGHGTIASKEGAHAEGSQTSASATCSHAEGGSTSASGAYSHAEGYGTIAPCDNQHVQGKFNIKEYTNNKNYAHVVGNGTSDTNRSNAHTLDWYGNAWYAGRISAEGIDFNTSTQNPSLVWKVTEKETPEFIIADAGEYIIKNQNLCHINPNGSYGNCTEDEEGIISFEILDTDLSYMRKVTDYYVLPPGNYVVGINVLELDNQSENIYIDFGLSTGKREKIQLKLGLNYIITTKEADSIYSYENTEYIGLQRTNMDDIIKMKFKPFIYPIEYFDTDKLEYISPESITINCQANDVIKFSDYTFTNKILYKRYLSNNPDSRYGATKFTIYLNSLSSFSPQINDEIINNCNNSKKTNKFLINLQHLITYNQIDVFKLEQDDAFKGSLTLKIKLGERAADTEDNWTYRFLDPELNQFLDSIHKTEINYNDILGTGIKNRILTISDAKFINKTNKWSVTPKDLELILGTHATIPSFRNEEVRIDKEIVNSKEILYLNFSFSYEATQQNNIAKDYATQLTKADIFIFELPNPYNYISLI